MQRALERPRAFDSPKLLLCNSAPRSYSFYIIACVSSHSNNIYSIICPPRKSVVIIGRIRDNNTYVLCITVKESRASITLIFRVNVLRFQSNGSVSKDSYMRARIFAIIIGLHLSSSILPSFHGMERILSRRK